MDKLTIEEVSRLRDSYESMQGVYQSESHDKLYRLYAQLADTIRENERYRKILKIHNIDENSEKENYPNKESDNG